MKNREILIIKFTLPHLELESELEKLCFAGHAIIHILFTVTEPFIHKKRDDEQAGCLTSSTQKAFKRVITVKTI